MLFAIIPAYNEERTIAEVVRSVLLHVDKVIVVNDASTDDTAKQAQDSGAIVLTHLVNRGQGAALETGQAYARHAGANYVLHFDADKQMSPHDIPAALSALQSARADVLFGSRFLTKHNHIPWIKRFVLFPLARLINRTIFGIRLRDTHNGFRLFNKKALHAIHITQDRMAHATEIPSLAYKHNLKIIEFPVSVTYHEYGQDALDGITVVADLVTGRILQK